MLMSKEDKMELRRKAKFLEDMGYVVTEDAYGLEYDSPKMRLCFAYERYGDGTETPMRFKELNECYELGWIAAVRENLNFRGAGNKNILSLCIAFVKANYDKLMDIRYCRESDTLIDAYIERRLAEK